MFPVTGGGFKQRATLLARYQRGVALALLFAVLAATTFAASFAEAALSIDNSARFNSADSAYLSRTPGVAGDQRTFTVSLWLKPGAITSEKGFLSAWDGTNNNRDSFRIDPADKLSVVNLIGGAITTQLESTALFRDPAAYVHIVFAVDTTQATDTNRVKVWWNGQQITSWSTADWPAQNEQFRVNSTGLNVIGRQQTTAPQGYFDGYMSDYYLVDGQALTPSSFGETDTNGYWRPKSYSGTYGTNGFKLDFANSADLGNDVSGNNNDWTANNLDATDKVIDTPTSTFCSWNQFDKTATLSEGNLKAAATAATRSTFPIPSTGKWRFEIDITSKTYIQLGLSRAGAAMAGGNSGNFGFYDNGVGTHLFYDTANTNTYLATGFFANGDTLVVDVDSDNNKVWMARLRSGTLTYMNSGQSPDPASGTAPLFGTGSASPASIISLADGYYAGVGSGGSTETVVINCGQGGQSGLTYDSAAGGYFKSTVPSGFKALSTANLPAPAIAVPKNYFDALLYAGDGSTSNRAITGLNFQPDFAWFKNRGAAAHHILIDALRSGFPSLFSNTTGAEIDEEEFVSFDSGGFTIKKNATYDRLNSSGYNFVSWLWKESSTSGFDIVTYTGDGANPRSITHSLGAVPKFIIVKARSAAGQNWAVYSEACGTDNLVLDLTVACTAGGVWASSPTASAFNVTASIAANANGTTYIAYLWAEVPGFSKFGSYTGNGSADGPFVYTGFKPRYFMWKRTDSADDWHIMDTARNPYNVATAFLIPNSSGTESTASTRNMDFVSNGIKIRASSHSSTNLSGATYIYAAFAEQPFKYSALSSVPPPTADIVITSDSTIAGNAAVTEGLFKGSGTFAIDHPLDPENKLLFHSFVESPDVTNMYDGIVALDDRGRATVQLPDYFLALNKDFKYFLTAIGEPMPGLYISRQVKRRYFFGLFGPPVFQVAGGALGGRVSWQVNGVRRDPYIIKHPIVPEVEKGPGQIVDVGQYLFPEFYATH